MAARKKLTGMAALIKVLQDNGNGPMKVSDLTAAAIPLTDLKGKTPAQTLAARLYTTPGTFAKAGRGMIKLAPAFVKAQNAPAAKPAAAKPAAAKDGQDS